MSETIYKYPITLTDRQMIAVPNGATPLSVQLQQERITLWMRVQPDAHTRQYLVTIVGTGHRIPDDAGDFIGTVQTGPFVWHLFGRFS